MINEAAKDGWTLLIVASQKGHVGAMQILIKAKAAVDQATEDGATPIFIASQNGHAPAIRLLLEAGARSAELMFQGKVSPLHTAAEKGHLECVKLLTGSRPNTAAWTTFLIGSK